MDLKYVLLQLINTNNYMGEAAEQFEHVSLGPQLQETSGVSIAPFHLDLSRVLAGADASEMMEVIINEGRRWDVHSEGGRVYAILRSEEQKGITLEFKGTLFFGKPRTGRIFCRKNGAITHAISVFAGERVAEEKWVIPGKK